MILLLVEDDSLTSGLTGRLLAGYGYTTRTAGGPEDALAQIRQQMPHAVVTDWVMDGGGGPKLLEELAAEPGFCVPVVVTTALSDQSLPPLGGHVKAVLHKPFATEELVATLESLGIYGDKNKGVGR